MLVLSRKKNQSLKLGDEIEIKILDVNGDQIRLGIEAPSSVRVLRKELYVDIHKQNLQAAVLPDSLRALDKLSQSKNKKAEQPEASQSDA